MILTASLPKAEEDLFSSDNSIIHAGYSEAWIFAECTNQVFIHIESPEAGILVHSDTWWPGERVYVDGVEKSILKLNFGVWG